MSRLSLRRLAPPDLRRIPHPGKCRAPLFAIGAFAAGAGLAPLVLTAQAPVIRLHGGTPRQLADGGATLAGHYNPAQMLRVVIGIKPPHMAEEEQFLQDLMNPHSPDFHRFLTAEQWNARFAPSAADEQRVVDWARAQGLTVTNRFANRLLVDLEAPAGTLEKAFGVTINNYRLRDEVDFSNDRDPLIPAELANLITAVMGLNSIQRAHYMHPGPELRGPDYSPGPPIVNAGTLRVDARPRLARSDSVSPNVSDGYVDPGDLYSSETYDFWPVRHMVGCCNFNGSPAPETSIAIPAFNSFDGNDFIAFVQAFNMAGNLTQFNIDGTPAGPDVEPAMDAEWSSALANSFGSYLQTAEVFVYEGANGDPGTLSDVYNYMLTNGYARVFSASYGCAEYLCGENNIEIQHNIFNSMVGQGWTLLAASGDGGATADCHDTYPNPATTSVSYPASDPDVLAVGGTFLEVDEFGNWVLEEGWRGGNQTGDCAANNGGSGGGYSTVFPAPGYQSAFFNNSARMLPDISLSADAYAFNDLNHAGQAVYFNGGWVGMGGTSIAAPEMAAFFVQENLYLHTIGYICGPHYNELCGPYGQPHNAIYSEGAAPSAEHYPFYGMTQGCNSNDETLDYNLAYYCAGPGYNLETKLGASTGYNLVTGWGSANMMQLSWALNWERLAVSANGAPYLTFSGPPEGRWYHTDQEISFVVNDNPGEYGSPIGTGIAGYTAAWDNAFVLFDSYGASNGGTGDPFYSGPNAYGVAGCLAVGTQAHPHCTVTSQQGCHFAYVIGWNNEGWNTSRTPQGAGQVESYGPVCYDTTPPLTVATVRAEPTEPLAATRTYVVTLNASDAYSGVAATRYFIVSDGQPLSEGFLNYAGPLTITSSTKAATFVYYESIDNAGNLEPYKLVSF